MIKNQIVLIVEDNPNFSDRMTSLLFEEANIIDTITARDYEEACHLIKTEKPDIVLLDINLPGKNGTEVLKFINQSSSPCKVIMVTNHADEYYRQQCFELGAKHFLDKSNDFDKVPAIIKSFRYSDQNI